jgi:hypothetical protein
MRQVTWPPGGGRCDERVQPVERPAYACGDEAHDLECLARVSVRASHVVAADGESDDARHGRGGLQARRLGVEQ